MTTALLANPLVAPLLQSDERTVLVFGTYAADFNNIEYAQKLAHYAPKLAEQARIDKIALVVNGSPAAAARLRELLELPEQIELLADPSGDAGRAFGVSRGWLADRDTIELGESLSVPISPYAKLFGMLFGLGAWLTLPSVVAGYVGNPGGTNRWIVDALAQGQRAGRWPDTALDLGADGRVTRNAFDELPLVGGWGRRPLELATLRLQTMVGVSLANWSELQPDDGRCLTQLGGLLAFEGDKVLYEWYDQGICNTADFEDLLRKLS